MLNIVIFAGEVPNLILFNIRRKFSENVEFYWQNGLDTVSQFVYNFLKINGRVTFGLLTRRKKKMVSPYLTDVQRKEWEKEGFLIIKNVLSSAEIEILLTAVDSAIETYVQETPNLQGDNPFGKGAYTIIRAIERNRCSRSTHRSSTHLRYDPFADGTLSPNHGNANLRSAPRC